MVTATAPPKPHPRPGEPPTGGFLFFSSEQYNWLTAALEYLMTQADRLTSDVAQEDADIAALAAAVSTNSALIQQLRDAVNSNDTAAITAAADALEANHNKLSDAIAGINTADTQPAPTNIAPQAPLA